MLVFCLIFQSHLGLNRTNLFLLGQQRLSIPPPVQCRCRRVALRSMSLFPSTMLPLPCTKPLRPPCSKCGSRIRPTPRPKYSHPSPLTCMCVATTTLPPTIAGRFYRSFPKHTRPKPPIPIRSTGVGATARRNRIHPSRFLCARTCASRPVQPAAPPEARDTLAIVPWLSDRHRPRTMAFCAGWTVTISCIRHEFTIKSRLC